MKIIGGVLIFLTASIMAMDDALTELQNGNLEFSASLYRELAKENTGNIIMSPLSVQLVLALTQLGSKGETALELTKGLHLPNTPEKIKESFKALLPKLKGNQFYSLDSANKIFLKDNYEINPEFMKLAVEIFDAGLENVDFTNNVKASETINKWVETKTNEKIKNLISPDQLDALTRLVLVNAVYFKANWTSPFETYETQKRKFFKTEKEEIEVDTMSQTETFKYCENKELDVKFLEIPYEGNDVTFTIVLPNKKEGLGALEGRLSEIFRPQNYKEELVHVLMPKFKIESTFKLIPTLEKLGIKKAFDSSQADLSGLLLNKEPLVISDVIQKAFINVTEKGTEAAAATAVLFVPTSAFVPSFPPLSFYANHPFFYIVRLGNVPIFIGRVVEIEN